MNTLNPRLWARALCRAVLYGTGRPIGEAALRQPSIVFSPHQDDESLGCGGTIVTMRRLDTPVWIVFMTDGTRSHRRFLPVDELKALRHAEALEAGQRLGVAAERVRFLDFEDGTLRDHVDAATGQVAAILRELQPGAVFVPYEYEQPEDHWATFAAVKAAAQQAGRPLTMYEYPVWYWFSWPWVERPRDDARWQGRYRRNTRASLRAILRRDFRVQVDVRAALDDKRHALMAHRSQVTRYLPEREDWPILDDMAGGQWVAAQFAPREVFRPSRFP